MSDPPAHAVVLSIDEKSQIQGARPHPARTADQARRCQTMTHDYKRHGTTTLFAALSVLDGMVIGLCMQRHRHLQFIRFLNAVEREVPAGKLIRVLDNYATHKHPKGAGLAGAPSALDFPFHPDLSLVAQRGREFFSKMTRQGGRDFEQPRFIRETGHQRRELP
jgi:hypothetical protein